MKWTEISDIFAHERILQNPMSGGIIDNRHVCKRFPGIWIDWNVHAQTRKDKHPMRANFVYILL